MFPKRLWCAYTEIHVFYTHRVTFLASDSDSGVHKLQIKLHIQTKGKDAYTIFDNDTISQRGVSHFVVIYSLFYSS